MSDMRYQPGSREHRQRYKILRITVATLGALIAAAFSAFIVYYFHLVDFLTMPVNCIIRIFALAFFFAVCYMYVRYLQSLDYEYDVFYRIELPQEAAKQPKSAKRKKKAEKKTGKKEKSEKGSRRGADGRFG